MDAGARFSLVFALPAALCLGLAGACTDGTTPNCSGDNASLCNEGASDGNAPADTGSSADTGSGQESGSGAEAGTDATAADAEGGAGHDASAADGDASHLQDAHGQ
jgi:hypothetical protein